MAENENNVKFFGAATLALENKDPFGRLDVEGTSFNKDPMWDFAFADDLKLRWNKSYPYQLLILKKKNGTYSLPAEDTFTLPIGPTNLNISTPFAIETTATVGGVLEEHNGAPIRSIILQGTTGVLPLKGTVEGFKTLGVLQDIGVFGGTLQAINQIRTSVEQYNNLIGADGGSTPVNVHPDSDFEGDIGKSTGYYQFMLLQRFLESYATQSKTNKGKDLRLALTVWKEQAVYLVTPISFDLVRSADKPLEYLYSLKFKAWRRITLQGNNILPFSGKVGLRDPSKFSLALNNLEAARNVLFSVKNTLIAVRGDVQDTVFTPLRQTILFGKELQGAKQSINDFPSDLKNDFRQPLLEYFGNQTNSPPTSKIASQIEIEEAFKVLSVESNKTNTKSGDISTNRTQSNKNGASPADKVIDNSEDYPDFFSNIKISDLNLHPETTKKINEERNNVHQLRREDFEKTRNNVLQLLSDFSDFVGVGSATYTRTYGLPQRTSLKSPTDNDWEIIYALNSAAQSLDSFAVSYDINQDTLNTIEIVAGLASKSGIAFKIPKSKFAVPFPYGYTLERLADRYLGDPNRWHEIATLNGLNSPYVDEEGFSEKLLVNGNKNQITINKNDNLYVGQFIYIQSVNVSREKRQIQGIQHRNNQTLITLNGDANLERFSTIAFAEIQAFLPNTVNSQMQIYIPSDKDPSEDDFRVKKIPGIDYFDPLVRSSGVDLLLTSNGDLIFTPDGDSRFAVGLSNLIQVVKLAIGTPKGSLLHHPEYGLNIKPGVSVADLNSKQILSDAKHMLKGDPSFAGVEFASLTHKENYLTLTLGIKLATTNQVIPIQLEIKK